MIDCTGDEEQEAKESNLSHVPVQNIHYNTVAKRDQQTNQSGQRLTERREKHADDSEGQHALSTIVEDVILKVSDSTFNACDEKKTAEVVMNADLILLMLPH